ncbi:hypothetical protein [Arthrobacter sp. Rue61a]|uniref:hypothetical protein n=1 Tax=Arthrobacter sp. Rue61a TaxID=1118963 RepID=UPI0002D48239|nr:hypothetical protein [Arthrobacter sp. Rue61a]
MTQTLTPATGMTCTYGSGKTIWEIVHIDYDESGAPKQLHMSKAGGDGYTNRWATPDEIRKLTARALKTSLGDVLKARTESAHAATELADAIKRHAKPGKLETLIRTAHENARAYQALYAAHLLETTGSSEGEKES